MTKMADKRITKLAQAYDEQWKEKRATSECCCAHTAEYLQQEIAAKRWVQEYRELDGKTVLVCVKCDGAWDYRATDRLIEKICGKA